MMKAGTYYVGDLCYVLHAEWYEVCGHICAGFGTGDGDFTLKPGEFTLKSGVKFACYSTMYGDGTYEGNGHEFGVDSGTLGCVLLSDIDLKNVDNYVTQGAVFKFSNDFNTFANDGVITFGHVTIDTNDDEVIDDDEISE